MRGSQFLYKVSPPQLKNSAIIYLFCHPQFSSVIQNIENRCAILTPVCYQNNQFFSQKSNFQNFALMAQQFSIFWITLLNCG